MQKKYERDLKDKVLHVIHGAMPANGSAETYSIVRKGVAGAVRQILGPDAPLPGWCCCGPPVLCSFCHLNEKDTMAYLTLTVAHTVQKVGSGMNATA